MESNPTSKSTPVFFWRWQGALPQAGLLLREMTGPAEVMERLRALGFIPGVYVDYLGRAPLGGPLLFRLGSLSIALRKEEFSCLKLQ